MSSNQEGCYTIADSLNPAFGGLITWMNVAPPNLFVLHTPPGHAQALAEQLDRAKNSLSPNISLYSESNPPFWEILGTIAGDDIVLVVVHNEQTLQKLSERIRRYSNA